MTTALSQTPTALARRRFMQNKAARFGLCVLLTLLILAAVSPQVLPYSYDAVDWSALEQAPSWRHPLGTDSAGRDLLARLALATGLSLSLGLLATLVSVSLGIFWGAVAGFAGGRIDALMMRVVDILYALPFMFLVILLMVVFGRNIFLIFLGVGAVEWLTLARIVRGQTLHLKNQPFVEASRACGASPSRLVRRHIVPNLLGVVAVYATLTVPQVILVESFLSFLGLGVQEPLTSLGVLIKDGVDVLEIAPWLLMIPGFWLSVLLIAFNLVGDGLRDALDPKDR